MKSYSWAITALFFFLITSCQTSVKLGPKVEIYINGPIKPESEQFKFNELTECFPKLVVNNQNTETEYIFNNVNFIRIDLRNKKESMKIKNNFINSIKIKAGIELTADDIKNNLNESNELVSFPSKHIKRPTNNKIHKPYHFPKGCIMVSSIADMRKHLTTALSNPNNNNSSHIKFGFNVRPNNPKTIKVRNKIPNHKSKREEINIIEVKKPKVLTNSCETIKPFFVGFDNDYTEIKWNRKNKGLKYKIQVTRDNKIIINKYDITSTRISLKELNEDGVMTVGPNYLFQLTGFCDENSVTEIYAISLYDNHTFFPSCKLKIKK